MPNRLAVEFKDFAQPRSCKLCDSPHREDIEALLNEGAKFNTLSKFLETKGILIGPLVMERHLRRGHIPK